MPKPTDDELLSNERSINLSHLITLSLVVRFGSFSRAAESMNVSQPTVSQQIRDLERHVGLPLVIAQGRTLKVTDAGSALAEIGHRLANERERAIRIAKRHLDGVAGKLIVAASMTTGTYLLPAVIAQLTARLPDAIFELRVANTFDVAEMVSEDIADIGVIEGQVNRPELAVTPIARDTLTCIASATFRTGTGLLTADDVRDQSLLVREDGSGTRQVVADALSSRGFTFKRIVGFGTNESIKAGVAQGLGIAWLSTRAVEAEIATHRVRELRFDTPQIERDLSAIRRREVKPTPLAEAFLAALRM